MGENAKFTNANGRLDTTEVYSVRDNVWTEAGKLPARIRAMRAATIDNRVLLFGKKDHLISCEHVLLFRRMG